MTNEREKLTWSDFMWAIMLGVLMSVLAWWWGDAGTPSDMWEEISVAAGLRPPTAPFPCVWHAMVQGLFGSIGVNASLAFLRVAGPIALGIATGVGFILLYELVPAVLRGRMQLAGWSRFIVRIVLAQGAVCFACSEPVWNVCRFFSPATLQFIITVAAAALCVRAFRLKIMRHLYAAAAMLGVLAAETPVGIVLPIGLIVYGWWKGGRASVPGDPDPLINPFVRTMVVRRITYSFFCGFLPAVALNVVFFCAHDGLEAQAWNGFEYVLHVVARYVQLFATAASVLGWAFLVVFALLPLLLAGSLLRKATDDDQFMPLTYGIFYVFVGAVAFLQLDYAAERELAVSSLHLLRAERHHALPLALRAWRGGVLPQLQEDRGHAVSGRRGGRRCGGSGGGVVPEGQPPAPSARALRADSRLRARAADAHEAHGAQDEGDARRVPAAHGAGVLECEDAVH